MKRKNAIKIAIIGSRGIPARYGGFEIFTERLVERLEKKDVKITVYCMPFLKTEPFNLPNVKRVFIPTLRISVLEKFIYSTASVLHAIFLERIDIIFLIGSTGSMFLWLAKIFSIKTIVNIDGLEWKRSKWSYMVRYALKILELMSIKSAEIIVADSQTIASYIRSEYKKESVYIPYGSEECSFEEKDWAAIENKFNLLPNSYYLVVGRFVPENNFPMIIDGFLISKSTKKLVIVSDKPSSYSKYYKNERVIFTGPIYNRRQLFALRRNAFVYVHGHSVGGTNPSLIEAMASGNIIFAYDVPYNREVVGEYGYYFKTKDEFVHLVNLIENNTYKTHPNSKRLEYYNKMLREKYNWEIVADKYFRIINSLLQNKRRK